MNCRSSAVEVRVRNMGISLAGHGPAARSAEARPALWRARFG